MQKNSLGSRMKGYESISRFFLTRRTPVIIRVDGKAFHTFTKGMKKPFDCLLMDTMEGTMLYLCKNVQNCVFGYTQSDEITLVLVDYTNPNTSAWFDNGVQKMASVVASMTTTAFNRLFREGVEALEPGEYADTMRRKLDAAMFDARVFSLPKDEVCNCLIWRQQDATRNSIQAVGQANFSHKELQGKTCDEIQEMLFSQKGINWNNLRPSEKRGTGCFKISYNEEMEDPRNPGSLITVARHEWVIDADTPIFTQNRSYIERLI